VKLSEGLTRIRGVVTYLIDAAPRDEATDDALDIMVEVAKKHPEWDEFKRRQSQREAKKY
jgi:hypothetical protein